MIIIKSLYFEMLTHGWSFQEFQAINKDRYFHYFNFLQNVCKLLCNPFATIH